MIVLDANLLLYAYDEDSRHHQGARLWLEAALNGPEPVGFAWVAVLAFLRVVTHPRLARGPMTMDAAGAAVDAWLSNRNAVLLNPGGRHWTLLRELLVAGQIRGNLTTDAHLATLALENGATLATNDRDFSRFPKLRVSFPLQP